jgi:hypothetical protein
MYIVYAEVSIFSVICEGCYGQSVHAGILSFEVHEVQPHDNMFPNIVIYANDLLNCLISIKAMWKQLATELFVQACECIYLSESERS